MKKRCGVYKFVSPNNRVYIGSSNDLDGRYSFYKNGHSKKQILLHRSFEKYGFENHSFEILCECEPDERLKLEREYGILYDSISDKGGLNLMLPKSDDKPSIYSQELRNKFSEIAKKRKYKKETLIKFSNARKDKYKNGNHPMAKLILNTESGIYYLCLKEAAESFDMKRTTLNMMLTGKNKNNTSFIYA